MPLRLALRLTLLLALALTIPVATPPLRAQTAAGPVRLFLDCQNTYCDTDFLRTEVAFVDYVRDRTDADVHVIVTTQANGAGGQTYTLRFLGLGQLAGADDELTFATAQTDTEDARRRALARTLAAGLVRYAARAGRLDGLTVTYAAPAATASTAPARDPWNRWVFNVGARGFFNGDKNYTSRSLNANGGASRTTPLWKTNVNGYVNDNRDTYRLSDSTEDVSTRSGYGTSALAARALGPRTTAGAEVNVFQSTFNNTDLATRVAVGVEANAFPYTESTRRSVTAKYAVGVQRVAYVDSTLFDKLDETLLDHALVVGVDLQQPWGTVGFTASGSQYLNHPKQYDLSLNGNVDIRLFRGLSFNAGGFVSFLRNQRQIERGEATDADVFTRRRALASGYNYFASAGLRYTFGSIFNAAVNPRYTGSNRSFFF